MLEKALSGGRRYWTWVGFLLLVIAAGFLAYMRQLNDGLQITGLSRDVPWGLYISQFTFMVGVAASAVMVVLPYYLHSFKPFGKMVIMGECLAISAVIMCMLFIFVDMGQPTRVINVIRFPTFNSLMFWDMLSLMGYLVLNVVISLVVFGAERKEIAPPKWIKPVIILSIPWAVSIHTVTAFLYSGLEARSFWMTAILVPRFLASAFASGPSLLIILSLLVRHFTKFDPGTEAIKKLSTIVTYALLVNIFFVAVELFTGIYSDIPEHMHHFQYLFLGLDGFSGLRPWMWMSLAFSLGSAVLMLQPKIRGNLNVLPFICVAIIVAVWIEKGLGLVVAGFIPNTMGTITEYFASVPETLVTLGVYGIGFLILTGLYKITITVRERG
ncbi:polysulfide reductase NrfD [bacterium]|nr:polysulfide reductase NrfD [bacterium]